MSRLQLALDVTDLDAAVAFYSTLFDTPPHKRRDGYANFAVEDPPLKLVLIEGARGGTLNHLGVEVGSPDQVAEATSRLERAGLATDTRESELCCHAVQDKVWVHDPDAAPWEVYAVLDDTPSEESDPAADATVCCTRGAAEVGTGEGGARAADVSAGCCASV